MKYRYIACEQLKKKKKKIVITYNKQNKQTNIRCGFKIVEQKLTEVAYKNKEDMIHLYIPSVGLHHNTIINISINSILININFIQCSKRLNLTMIANLV